MKTRACRFKNALNAKPDGMLRGAADRYLENFGYRRASSAPQAEAGTDGGSARAIRLFQTVNGLPETGQIDDETRARMTRPRCGCPDHQARLFAAAGRAFLPRQCRWEKDTLTYALKAPTDDLEVAFTVSEIQQAFDTWEAVGVIGFQKVDPDAPDLDIEVAWVAADSDPSFSMVGDVIAHADFPGECHRIRETGPKPIFFDDSENLWNVGQVTDAFDIRTVAIHEIGHILGLLHENQNQDSAMFPFVDMDFRRWDLHPDDIANLKALYSVRPAAARRSEPKRVINPLRRVSMP